MSDSRKSRSKPSGPDAAAPDPAPSTAPGKVAHTDAIQRKSSPATTDVFSFLSAGPAAVQAKGEVASSPERVQAIASKGVEGSGSSLPHLETIQSSFGQHDVSGVRAHVGGTAAEASSAIGAQAYATGSDVAFQSSPDLHTAAHEAAHVVQQKAGVNLKGGVGQAGDAYEQHADAVADKVVAGESAEGLLGEMAGGSSVQRKAVQREGEGGGGGASASEGETAGQPAGNVVEQVTELMSYSVTDWAITDAEATNALNLLAALGGGALTATLGQLSQQTKTRLLDNLPASARTTPAFTKVLCAMGPTAIEPYIEELLTTGIFDWAVTDAEVETIHQIFSRLSAEQAVQLWDRLSITFRDRLLENMASGSALSPTAKAVLWTIAQGEGVDLATIKRLFEIRFRHALTDTPEDPATAKTEAASWDVDTVHLVWQQLDALPDSDVSDIQIWGAFQAINSTGGFYKGSHIEIGVNASPEKMAHTVRHEVGHGIHRALASEIDAWLQNSIDFWTTDQDSWITALGGYPDKYQHPTDGETDFDESAQGEVKALIDSWLNRANWGPTRATVPTGMTAEKQAMWAAMPEAVRNACTQSTTNWYNNYANFQKAGGRSYFANHWYHTYYRFGATAEAAIAVTGDNYTAMSHKEFFANCYAEYFEDPEGINDHSKWGGSLPAAVKSFFDSVIVSRHPYSEWEAEQASEASGSGSGGEGDHGAGTGGGGGS